MSLTEEEKKKIEAEELYRAEVRGKLSKDLEVRTDKSKVVAGLLALIFGGIGIHKFYLGKAGWGIIYLIFFWTAIPAIISIFEGIIYLCMSDQEFRIKYS